MVSIIITNKHTDYIIVNDGHIFYYYCCTFIIVWLKHENDAVCSAVDMTCQLCQQYSDVLTELMIFCLISVFSLFVRHFKHKMSGFRLWNTSNCIPLFGVKLQQLCCNLWEVVIIHVMQCTHMQRWRKSRNRHSRKAKMRPRSH
jgi:hypothetical protein